MIKELTNDVYNSICGYINPSLKGNTRPKYTIPLYK